MTTTPPRTIRLKLPRPVGRLLARLLTARTVCPGAVVLPPAALKVQGPTLLYFKTEACVACDGLDLCVGQLAASAGLELRVIDARRGELPPHAYGDALLLDEGGEVRRAYGIRVFPTLVLTSPGGHIERVVMEVPEEPEAARGAVIAGLGLNSPA
ncbi:hypothetical protein K7W42_09995 [Deinococcus sp. HMF7604]|uniref:hypothetical protein n=1 Tax=Deinococcus betulae TaxID=2873312 RepID=UPI001CC938AC|nr:hypothetical protein [Deinococcus betulae]MBZ9751195.1 hypothetical protein [Deinococcus betulae]